MAHPRYVLITPVRNEARFVEMTIDAVAAQTKLPERWVIVSDGSTDGTDDIVRRRAAEIPFLRFSRREGGATRDFGSKVQAIREGLKQLQDVQYEFIGNLDGDISAAPDYFHRLLQCFEAAPSLGIAGGEIHEGSRISSRTQFINTERSVAGAVQMFRRECWEEIGGYVLLPCGGEDAAAEIMARMRGWETRTFRDLPVMHHRPTGIEGRGAIRSFYDVGRREAILGYHPLFEVLRSANRSLARPALAGGLVQLMGFLVTKLLREPLGLSKECVTFLRREQMERIRKLFLRRRLS